MHEHTHINLRGKRTRQTRALCWLIPQMHDNTTEQARSKKPGNGAGPPMLMIPITPGPSGLPAMCMWSESWSQQWSQGLVWGAVMGDAGNSGSPSHLKRLPRKKKSAKCSDIFKPSVWQLKQKSRGCHFGISTPCDHSWFRIWALGQHNWGHLGMCVCVCERFQKIFCKKYIDLFV